MVVDQNFHKVIKFLISLLIFISVPLTSFAQKYESKKIINLESPWGSSFLNDDEMIITEKSGKIKNAKHVPRGMLEFWIDPKSPYHRDYFNNKNKFIFLPCRSPKLGPLLKNFPCFVKL